MTVDKSAALSYVIHPALRNVNFNNHKMVMRDDVETTPELTLPLRTK